LQPAIYSINFTGSGAGVVTDAITAQLIDAPVLAEAVPFEHGFTRTSMALQARWEAKHARRVYKTDAQYRV
jgi:hypothetical protein